jgi:DNA-binding IclR family transcriptional regulator
MVLEYVTAHGRIELSQVMDLCLLNRGQAQRLLKRLVDAKKLSMRGSGRRWAYYVIEK